MPKLVASTTWCNCKERVVGRAPRPAGFTIVDVLVTMAVIAILVSLLAPSLTLVRESANQVMCRSNIRQAGLGIWMYAEHNKDRVPPSAYTTPDQLTDQPWETGTLRLGSATPTMPAGSWDGLGHLYEEDFLPAPKIFYCPSHRGANKYVEFAPAWAGAEGRINGNFQYRGRGPAVSASSTLIGGLGIPFLSGMKPSAALVSDGMRTQSDFNHEVGANVLRADNSVNWFNDIDGRLAAMLPRDGQNPMRATYLQAWEILDHPR